MSRILFRGGESSRGCLLPGGRELPPGGMPPPRGVLPPGGMPGGDPPGTATAAGGTHPTGMHSCKVMSEQHQFIQPISKR